MTTLVTGVTYTSGWQVTADTTGTLVIQTGSGPTTALTIDSSQNLQIAGTITASQFNGASTFGFKNRFINSDLRINQRAYTTTTFNNSTAATVGDVYFYDRWKSPTPSAVTSYTTTTSVFTVAITTNAASQGFPNCVTYTVTTAGVGGTNRDITFLAQRIEAGNLSDLAWGTASAISITISFWFRSSLAGQRSIFIYNPNAGRYYQAAFTINNANTWQFVSVVIPGDTGGGFGASTTEGLRIEWRTSCSGTFLSTASTAWAALGGQRGVTGDIDFFGTVNATMDIAGMQFEKGTTATSFDYRPIGIETVLCQRYYLRDTYTVASSLNKIIVPGYMFSTTQFEGVYNFPVEMRSAPTFGSSALATFALRFGAVTFTVITNYAATTRSCLVYTTNSATGSAQQANSLNSVTTNGIITYLEFIAEL